MFPGRLASCVAAVVTIGIATLWGAPAMAQYKLDAGDIVDVSIYGAPEMQRKVTVNIDGEISYPLVGMVKVSGLTLAALRERLQSIMVDRGIMKSPDVTVEISQYRPFYVSGDVSRPGSFAFQPGLTVRQAVTLAGGYDVFKFRSGRDPFVDASEFRSDYEALWLEIVKQEARIKRLKAELAGGTAQSLSVDGNVPVPKAIGDSIAQLEAEQLKLRTGDVEKEKKFLQKSLQMAQEQMDALAAIQKEDEDNLHQRNEDVARTKALYEKGFAPLTRLIEEQRQIVAARQRVYATQNQVTLAKSGFVQVERRMEQSLDQRKMDVTKEMQEATVELEKLRSRLQAASDKLLYATTSRSQMALGRFGAPEIAIVRTGKDKKKVRITVGEDSEVEPGDVIDIALKMNGALE
jgi:polysaccharide export outer membrane protein